MNSDKIELLAPAGSWEAFVAAVENGADAIYMGGKQFNARQFAGNFDSPELKTALDYAHLRNTRVYLTMNTLLNDSEIKPAVELVEEAYRLGIDAVIVQDIGFASLLESIFPDLELHASTQMTIYNPAGVKAVEEMGFKRVILARELSLEEIGEITKSTGLEVEVFIHGALCISYSGQCLMSSIIGGRSGNRGKCAQPCRMKYELLKNGINIEQAEYLMSSKDICSLNEIESLIKAGVRSLKIEGRMKTPEYVATVVRIYRKYIDRIIEGKGSVIEEKDMKELIQIFNRGGFSKGYLKGKTGRDMMSYEKPKNWGIYLGQVLSYDSSKNTVRVRLTENLSIGDGVEIWNDEETSPGNIITWIWVNEKPVKEALSGQIAEIGTLRGRIRNGNKIFKTSDKKLNVSARESFEGKGRKKSKVTGKIEIRSNNPAKLVVEDHNGIKAEIIGDVIPEPALKKPLTSDRLIEQLEKTGNTPFVFENIDVVLDDGLALPVSELNNLRRRALEQYEDRKIKSLERNMSTDMRNMRDELLNFPGNSRNTKKEINISVFLFSYTEGLNLKNLGADRIYIPFNTLFTEASLNRLKKDLEDRNGEIFLWVPNITRGNYDRLIDNKLELACKAGLDGIMAGNAWALGIAKRFPGLKIAGDYSFNAYNSFSLKKLYDSGFTGCTLSPELTLEQINEMSSFNDFQKEAIVYGRIPVMTSEYCPVGSTEGGHDSKNKCNNACLRGEYKLRDRVGMEFPVLCDRTDCRSTILNANVIYIADSLDKLKLSGVDIIRLNIFDESPDEIQKLVQLHREVLNNGTAVIKKYNDIVEAVKGRGFTKGHYFRGV